MKRWFPTPEQLAPPGPLMVLLGWYAAAYGLEARDPAPVRRVEVCVLSEQAPVNPWAPLELRSIAGVGRKRALQLALGAGRLQMDPNAPDLHGALQKIPGIGPATATRVQAWATQERRLTYTAKPREPDLSIDHPP